MTFDPNTTLHRDVRRRVGARHRVPASAATKLIVTNSGVQAVLPLRTQVDLHTAAHRLARAVLLLNLRLTGADFVVGCRVGSGLVLRDPQGVVIGRGAVRGERCTLFHRVTLGEQYGDGADVTDSYPRLGDGVVVGARAVVLGGISVGDNAVIGANAVVVRDVEAADVVAGAPAGSIRAAMDAGTSAPDMSAPK